MLVGGERLLTALAGGPVALGEHDQSSHPVLIARRGLKPVPEGEQVVDAYLCAAAAPDAPAWVYGQLERHCAVRLLGVGARSADLQSLGRAHRSAGVAERAALRLDRVGQLNRNR